MSYWLFMYMSIVKSWMIYYRERWTFYTIQQEWKHIINKKKESNNWFIRNNNKYGSLKFILKIAAIFHLIGFMLSIFAVTSANLDLLSRPILRTVNQSILFIAAGHQFYLCHYP